MKMFTYIPENPAISAYISFIWELEGNRNSNELILPSGVVEIVFNLAQPIKAILPNGKFIDRAPDCFVQGIHTQVIKVTYSDLHHLFGVRLKPHAVRGLLGILPSEINNKAVDMMLIKPDFKALWNRLGEVRSFGDRVRVLESFFKPVDDLACHRSEMLSRWFLKVGYLQRTPYNLKMAPEDNLSYDSVDSLARQINYSARHLNRKSHEIFGLTAEELVRYKKFLRAVELMHHEKYSLTEVSYLAGFFDQSHFIRVFKSLAGMTPKTYLQSKGHLPFHLFV